MPEPRYLLIACEVLFRECAAALAACPAVVDPVFLPKALHDQGEAPMSGRIQAAIDAADCSRYDAVLLAYGLCNYGTRGLHAPIPLVLPRAHDCITLLLGSRKRYDEYFAANTGTFFRSPGWLERDSDPQASPASVTSKLGLEHDRAKLVEQYGEEEADYLMEMMGDWFRNYRRLAYIDTGTGDAEALWARARADAEQRGWEAERVSGDRRLIEALLAGGWSEDEFLVIRPGEQVDAAWDGRIVCPARRAGKET